MKNSSNLANNIENILIEIQNKSFYFKKIKDNSNEKSEDELIEEKKSNKSLNIKNKKIKEKI